MRYRIFAGQLMFVFLLLAACADRTNRGDDEHTEDSDSLRVVLSAAAFTTAEIEVEVAVGEAVSEVSGGLEVPGQVNFDSRRVAIISPRVSGRIERLFVVDGDRVRTGQVVAHLFTPAFITAQSEYLQATRRATLLANTADAQGAAALRDAAANRLRQIGASFNDIARLAATGQVQEYLSITAPFGGSIFESNSLVGTAVEAGSPLFKIANISFVDVIAAVPEQSVPLVQIGGPASVRIAAYPKIEFAGEVERIQQQLDESTRTVGAVIHVRNVNETLKPGMFATVRLELPTLSAAGASRMVLTIPETAVLSDGDRRFVFIETGPRTFERREVEVASLEAPGASQPLSNRVVVRSGIRPGERVVTRGAFTLKSELGKAKLGEHGH